MIHRRALAHAVVAAILACCAPSAFAQSLGQSFFAPPDDARPMVRWWWYGPSVEEDELAREIAAMRAGGFGGFEIQPVYPLAVDDARYRNGTYLSADFLSRVRFAAETARAQGLTRLTPAPLFQ